MLPWFTAVLVLLPLDGTHYLRLAHSTTWLGRAEVVDDFSLAEGGAPDRQRWLLEVGAGAAAAVVDGRLRFDSPAGVPSFAHLRMPQGRQAPEDTRFWLPRGFYDERYAERLEWDAQVERQNDFLALLETRTILVQARSYGLHVTYPGTDGSPTEHRVETPLVDDGRPHRYRLERDGDLIRLRLDGHGIWVFPDAGNWEFVRFGETRADPLHGGTQTVDSVRYTRFYRSLPPEPAAE
jgi:hypothetical protein